MDFLLRLLGTRQAQTTRCAANTGFLERARNGLRVGNFGNVNRNATIPTHQHSATTQNVANTVTNDINNISQTQQHIGSNGASTNEMNTSNVGNNNINQDFSHIESILNQNVSNMNAGQINTATGLNQTAVNDLQYLIQQAQQNQINERVVYSLLNNVLPQQHSTNTNMNINDLCCLLNSNHNVDNVALIQMLFGNNNYQVNNALNNNIVGQGNVFGCNNLQGSLAYSNINYNLLNQLLNANTNYNVCNNNSSMNYGNINNSNHLTNTPSTTIGPTAANNDILRRFFSSNETNSGICNARVEYS